jgi:hypothetical protein
MKIQNRDISLMASRQYTGQNRASLSTRKGSIAAPCFLGDDGGPQLTFGQVVRRIQFTYVKKAQQMFAVFSQSFGKSGVGRHRDGCLAAGRRHEGSPCAT